MIIILIKEKSIMKMAISNSKENRYKLKIMLKENFINPMMTSQQKKK